MFIPDPAPWLALRTTWWKTNEVKNRQSHTEDPIWLLKGNLSVIESIMFQENTLTADALAPCVARTSAARDSSSRIKRVLVFHKDGFYCNVPTQILRNIRKCRHDIMFLKIKLAALFGLFPAIEITTPIHIFYIEHLSSLTFSMVFFRVVGSSRICRSNNVARAVKPWKPEACVSTNRWRGPPSSANWMALLWSRVNRNARRNTACRESGSTGRLMRWTRPLWRGKRM